mmetsp:Transcript_19502/g.62658  ORF Transcript_19502/g.62658 Transcript_19502/m.62658 type:complete len:310 (-) Transcript_19502:1666-2595(-)
MAFPFSPPAGREDEDRCTIPYSRRPSRLSDVRLLGRIRRRRRRRRRGEDVSEFNSLGSAGGVSFVEELTQVLVVWRLRKSLLEVGLVYEVSRAAALVEESLKLDRVPGAEFCRAAHRHRLVPWVDAKKGEEGVRRALQVVRWALFEAEVSRTGRLVTRPHKRAVLRKRNACTVGEEHALGQAEVDDEDLVGLIATSATDVRRLDVAMKKALGVDKLEAEQEHDGELEDVGEGHRLSDRVELVRQRRAEEVHDQTPKIILLPEPVDLRNVIAAFRAREQDFVNLLLTSEECRLAVRPRVRRFELNRDGST